MRQPSYRAGKLYYYLVYIHPFKEMLHRACRYTREKSNMLFRSNERMSEGGYAELLVYLVEEEKDIKTAQPLR